MRLFSYKLTDDTGFAPNPFHDFLTLACCKPGIRKTKKPGDWIAGFTSKELNGDKVGEERLIFLMQVEFKKTFQEYWEEEPFQVKKNNPNSEDIILRRGDNIYKPNLKSELGFDQIPNRCHNEGNKEDDLKGEYVHVSNTFYYFGRNALSIENKIRPKVPISQTPFGWITHDEKILSNFLDYILKNFETGRGRNLPHTWKEVEKSICKEIG